MDRSGQHRRQRALHSHGTGARPGGQAVLEPNPEWALEPEPALRKITIKFIDDLEAAFQAFRSGQLDMTNVPASEIPTIEADATLNSQFLKGGATRMQAVEMQMNNPTIADFNVRLALSRAIDRNTLVEEVTTTPTSRPPTGWRRACRASRVTRPSRTSSATTRRQPRRRWLMPATPTARASPP